MIIQIARADGATAASGGSAGVEELLILELQGHVLPTKPASSVETARTAASGRSAAAGVVDASAALDGLLIGHLTMRPVRVARAPLCSARCPAARHARTHARTHARPPKGPTHAPHARCRQPPPPPPPPQDGKGQLQVGNHRITGSLETLPKPLVLIDRAPAGWRAGGAAPVAPGDEELLGPAYVVKGVIRKRLRFEDRPQTLIRAAQ